MSNIGEKDRIIKEINKKGLRILSGPKEGTYKVIWNEKKKTKIGYINLEYMHRYGIRTIATLKHGSKGIPWVYDSDVVLSNDELDRLRNNNTDDLPKFDCSMLKKIEF